MIDHKIMYNKPTYIASSKKQASVSRPSSNTTKEELKSLDSRLDQIYDKNIQPTPYLLTVPSERPYNLDRRLANDWRRGTPFDRDEEKLQYVSFLPDWDHGLIAAVGGWSNEKGEMERPSSARSSTMTPPVGAKTKISLSEYKKKTTGQASTLGTSKRGDAGQVTNGIESKPTEKAQAPVGAASGQKRSREAPTEPSISKPELQDKESIQVFKKRRPSLSPSISSSNARQDKKVSTLELPPFISPTLPPIIEKELKRQAAISQLDLDEKRSEDWKTSSRVSGFPKARTSDNGTLKSKMNGVPKRAAESAPSRGQGTSSQSSKALEKVVEKPTARKTSSMSTKIVKLKIPKQLRTRCAALLKMPPARQKSEAGKGLRTDQHAPVVRSIERDAGKAPAKSVPGTDTLRREKRQRQDDSTAGSAPQSKRPRQPSDLKLTPKPSTPIPGAFKSPVMSHHGSAQKSKGPTPIPDVSTPQGAVQNGTPAALDSIERPVNKYGRLSPRPALHRVSNNSLKDIHDVQILLHDLGRTLKYDAIDEYESRGDTQKEKLGQAYYVESILCFMFSYAVRDEVARMTRTKPNAMWSTILPHISMVKHQIDPKHHTGPKHEMERQRLLHGLVLQLEAYAQMSLWKIDYDRLSSGANDPSALEKTMQLHYSSTQLFIEGSSELSIDDLQTSFPHSWRAKNKTPLAKDAARGDIRLDGDFYLPISSITTTLEAVRAGHSLLWEWCKQDKVDWKSRIGDVKVKIDMVEQDSKDSKLGVGKKERR